MPPVATDEDDLGTMWSLVSRPALHGALCACFGIDAAFSPPALERQVLAFLQAQYWTEAAINQAIGERLRAPDGPFVAWFGLLGAGGPLTSEQFAMLRADLLRVLRSMVAPRRFACT